MSAGIDYGLGQTNVDKENGIRYGVISQYSVGQAWYDESEGIYPEHDGCQDEELNDDVDTDPSAFVYEKAGYVCEQGGDSTEIFIIKSPYYTLCKFCSPCFPGAGDLDSPDDDGIKAYCFGPDWFENNVAPYPVFRVVEDEDS